MVFVLIRRCVRTDKEGEFLKTYSRERPTHPDFVEETLTRVTSDEDLPEPMRSLPLEGTDCVTYLNIAKWKSWQSFNDWFNPKTFHDPSIEVSDRLRLVLSVVD